MKTPDRIKKSMRYSIIDGSFWSVMYGMGERYLSAFAVFLKATNMQIGLLASLPLLFGSIFQFFSVKLIDTFKSRKRFVVITALIQAFTWIPIIFVYYMGNLKVYFLILFAIFYFVSGLISSPAWNSWISDLVPPEQRGAYFAKRSKIIGLVILLATIAGGIVLQSFKDGMEKQYLGFFALFAFAFFARLLSAFFLNKKYEPPISKPEERDAFTFIEFIKQARFRNYGLFVIFLTIMNFSVYVAVPFFAAYMLYDLRLSYFAYMILISVSFLARYITLPVWGSLSDKYGNKKILGLNAYFIAVLPILWVFSKDFYYLFIINIISGIAWGGFELSTFNFVFDTTTPQKRPRCVAYYNVINGVMVFLGAAVGGWIIKYNPFFFSQYYPAFIASTVLRFATVSFFVSKLKEVKIVKEISYRRIFFKAMDMIMLESFHKANFLFNYHKRFKIIRK